MDRYCINRETLLDNAQLKTLLTPELHSVHCLVDVGVCRDSGYEILAPLASPTADAAYCHASIADALLIVATTVWTWPW